MITCGYDVDHFVELYKGCHIPRHFEMKQLRLPSISNNRAWPERLEAQQDWADMKGRLQGVIEKVHHVLYICIVAHIKKYVAYA